MDDDCNSAVYSRLEKSGIISNVRTHLRHNLVNALRNKDMTLNKGNAAPKCAKQYVYDLLVAEYLWNHSYPYTLSVFASEAPLLVNFCKNLPDNADVSSEKQKLQSDYVQHTLETLGIRPQDAAGMSIVRDYSENDMPLLLCILKRASLSFVNEKAQSPGLNDCRIVHSRETQTEGRYKNCFEVSKLAVAKRKLFQQKETFGTQLREKENELKEQAGAMERQLAMINEKLAKAQNLMRLVHLKQRQLSEEKMEQDSRIQRREIELSRRDDLITRETERLHTERDLYKNFRADLRKLQDELVKVKKQLSCKDEDENLTFRDAQVQTNPEAFGDEKLSMDRERAELSSLVKTQQSRIEELTLRAVSLSRQLEEARMSKKTTFEIPAPVVRFSKTHTVLSESSSTDDILQDARLRLRRLEEESLKADQCYFNCITMSPS